MKNNFSIVYACFLIIGDFLAVLGAFVVAYILRVKIDERPLIEQIPAITYLNAFITVLPLWILVHGAIGLYASEVYEKRFKELGRLLVGSFIGILVVIGYDFVKQDNLFPARLVPVYGLLLSYGFLVLFRTLARSIRQLLFHFNIGVNNVLIIGNTAITKEVADSIAGTSHTGLRVIGTVGCDVSYAPVYDSFDQAQVSISQPFHSIIQTELYSAAEKNNEIVRYAHENHVSYRFVPGNSDLFIGNIAVELYAGLPMVAVHQTALVGWGRITKRLFDLIASTAILFFVWPILLLVACLQKITDPNSPVFFRQTRLTRFNHEFSVYKFRTLKPKYNGLLPEEGFKLMGKPELAKTFREQGDFLANDPRLTRLGLFLRRTSLDELPQLFNVLIGHISLVGPRALVPHELNAYAKKHAILSVKSGLTGLAQVSGRKSISFDERRKLDIYYVQNWSFWLDISILVKTVKAVLVGTGAK